MTIFLCVLSSIHFPPFPRFCRPTPIRSFLPTERWYWQDCLRSKPISDSDRKTTKIGHQNRSPLSWFWLSSLEHFMLHPLINWHCMDLPEHIVLSQLASKARQCDWSVGGCLIVRWNPGQATPTEQRPHTSLKYSHLPDIIIGGGAASLLLLCSSKLSSITPVQNVWPGNNSCRLSFLPCPQVNVLLGWIMVDTRISCYSDM